MKIFRTMLFMLSFYFTLNGFSQTADSCLYVQVDLANRWIWRGVNYSEAPVIQPSLGYFNKKLNVLIWASYPFERRAYSEVDFTVEYHFFPKLKLGITDFFAINDSLGAKHNFFDLEQKTTMHMLDAYAIYNPSKRIPLSLLYSLWFWGADRKPSTLEQNFSSYIEAKYEKSYGKVKTSAFAGMTLGKGFYASRTAIVNLGVGISKPIAVSNSFSIPAKVEFILNPETQNVYINAIISIR